MIYKRFLVIVVIVLGLSVSQTFAQQYSWEQLSKLPSSFHEDKGAQQIRLSDFIVSLSNYNQTIQKLSPSDNPNFDFTTSKEFDNRKIEGMNYLGDINLQWKNMADTSWYNYSSAKHRLGNKIIKSSDNKIFSQSTINLPDAAASTFQIKRSWERNNVGGKDGFVLKFTVKNISNRSIEIGGLGFPLIFNNILHGQSLEQAHHENSFSDPYMGMHAGYLQVCRLDGKGRVLLVLPYGNTPFQNYRPLLEDPTPRGLDFEGFYEWNVFSKSYAQTIWNGVEQWNNPTSIILTPNEEKEWGLRFVLADSIKAIETKLIVEKRPVAMGIPGYVLPMDVNGSLFLHTVGKIKSIDIFPKDSLSIVYGGHKSNGWIFYKVKGQQFGRSRITIQYANGDLQTIHYKIIYPESTTIDNYGHFLNTKQWFEKDDPYFHRSPGYITYDNELHKQVVQDGRVWIAGMSDEGGAGSWLGAAMKEYVHPVKTEIQQLERFVDTTLWGHIQYSQGQNKWGVRKSLFFYAPDSLPAHTYDSAINFKTWAAWPINVAMDPGRSYNYPHVAAAYWTLYRLARNHKGLVEKHNWDWYLSQAYGTALAMVKLAPYYAEFGQMEGTIFYYILQDLKAEGKGEEAQALESEMKKRALHWDTLPFPFGSEMPWDSTGQEEVYIWTLYFGDTDKADITYNAILAYMPTIPHWGYNGNARRYWDFLYGGKLQRIERMIHHYGSELNAIPLLTYYRNHPNDLYTLRVAYGGVLGGISNIEKDGFAPVAFHSYPSTLKNDGISGDYGSGFFGYAINTGSYFYKDSNLGWLAFGGNIDSSNGTIKFIPTTAAKRKVFIPYLNLDVNLDAGEIKEIVYSVKTKKVFIVLASSDNYTPNAIVSKFGKYSPSSTYKRRSKDKIVIPLSHKKETIMYLERM